MIPIRLEPDQENSEWSLCASIQTGTRMQLA
jgi:hypothetical protein